MSSSNARLICRSSVAFSASAETSPLSVGRSGFASGCCCTSIDGSMPTCQACSPLAVSQSVDPDFRERFAEAYRRELQTWVEAISHWRSGQAENPLGPVNGPDAWDGYRVAVISKAVLNSMSKGVPSKVESKPMPDLHRRCRRSVSMDAGEPQS